MTPKKPAPSEVYCFSCEGLLLTEQERLGPICKSCFQKTKRRDPLMRAAVHQTVVAVVPVLCPHEKPHGRCRFNVSTASRFNVIVLDKKLDPIEITGPYTEKAAEKRAARIRRGVKRRGQ